jgi:1-acyl-sn-glycerol-3-phosphate acyltransferase
MRAIHAGFIAVSFTLWTLALLPLQLLGLRFRKLATGRWLIETVPQLYFRGNVWLLRVKIVRVGEVSPARPTLFVSNHVSWIDIGLLNATLKASFIAKLEVAAYPLMGWLAKLQRTVFIERKARRAAEHSDEMTARLQAGDSLILFPEGTSSDGMRLLEFKSAFFVLAERNVGERPLTVQPISIAYRRLAGLPIGRRWMSVVSWIGDEDLLSHLWRYLEHTPCEVVVQFHPPVTIADFASRKELSAHCRRVIATAVSDVHSGRKAA